MNWKMYTQVEKKKLGLLSIPSPPPSLEVKIVLSSKIVRGWEELVFT